LSDIVVFLSLSTAIVAATAVEVGLHVSQTCELLTGVDSLAGKSADIDESHSRLFTFRLYLSYAQVNSAFCCLSESLRTNY